jgi:hypothetical protein
MLTRTGILSHRDRWHLPNGHCPHLYVKRALALHVCNTEGSGKQHSMVLTLLSLQAVTQLLCCGML